MSRKIKGEAIDFVIKPFLHHFTCCLLQGNTRCYGHWIMCHVIYKDTYESQVFKMYRLWNVHCINIMLLSSSGVLWARDHDQVIQVQQRDYKGSHTLLNPSFMPLKCDRVKGESLRSIPRHSEILFCLCLSVYLSPSLTLFQFLRGNMQIFSNTICPLTDDTRIKDIIISGQYSDYF